MQKKSGFARFWRRGKKKISAAFRNLKKEGLASTASKTIRFLTKNRPTSYYRWMKTPLYTAEELHAQRAHVFEKKITFSLITPLYNTPAVFLREMIDSVLAQTYSDWELCLADGSDDEHGYVEQICLEYMKRDPRIRFRKLEKNLGIAGNSNECLSMAQGQYISLLDHDDLLHPAALHDVMEVICSSDADIVYTDEATFRSPDPKDIILVHFKPDFAPDNLIANNYICHFTSIRRSLLDKCGAFRPGYDGSQDHELMLRLTQQAGSVVHIPKVLYLWRAHPDSVAEAEGNKSYATEAGIKAVRDNLMARGIEASVESAKGIPTIYRVSYPLPSPEPLVSIIIPNCDHMQDLRTCVSSIRDKTTYTNYEIIIVENNSVKAETFQYYKELSAYADNIKVIKWPGRAFNWPEVNNYAIREAAAGEYLLLLNNDTEVITPDWIQEMLMYARREDVGAVGAMLYYPNDTIQHAGVIINLGGLAGHAFHHIQRGKAGYMGRLCYAQNLSAVTGACMMLRKDVWEKIGGIDSGLAVNYNDVDLCLNIRKAGYLIVWTPYAELYHYESRTRGPVMDAPDVKKEEQREKKLFRERWHEVMEKGDPYYNPNLTLRRSDFSPKNRKYE